MQYNVRVTKLTKPVNLGDAPVYDDECNSLYFVDDIATTIYRYEICSKRLYSVKIGAGMLQSRTVLDETRSLPT